MLSTEAQHSGKALIVKLDGGCTNDDAECVRMLTEVTFRDSVGEPTLSCFSGLGPKFLAEDAYVLDVCERLERWDRLPGSLISE